MESKARILTTEERLFAALAHGSVLLSFFGPLAPGFVWIGLRRKSRYAAFQSLQAMGYQALLLWVGLTIVLGGLLVFIFSDVSLFTQSGQTLDGILNSPLVERATLFQNIFYGVWGLLCLPGIVGAVFALAGREFYYPFLGKRLETFLYSGNEEIDETREDDWVAGICHSSAIVLLWGMILPWAVWSTQKERSARLRFQSLQAFLFQLLSLVMYGVAFGLLFAMMIFVVALAGYMNASAGISSDAGLYLIIVVLVMLLFMCVLLLALPMYHLFALIAWVRVARGVDYRYPILGKMIERRMKNER